MLQALAHHPLLLGFALTVLMMAQSAPVTGFFLPGIVVLPLLGAVTGSGPVPFWFLLGCVVVGAWFGDIFGFWVGRRARDKHGRWEDGDLQKAAVRAAHRDRDLGPAIDEIDRSDSSRGNCTAGSCYGPSYAAQASETVTPEISSAKPLLAIQDVKQ